MLFWLLVNTVFVHDLSEIQRSRCKYNGIQEMIIREKYYGRKNERNRGKKEKTSTPWCSSWRLCAGSIAEARPCAADGSWVPRKVGGRTFWNYIQLKLLNKSWAAEVGGPQSRIARRLYHSSAIWIFPSYDSCAFKICVWVFQTVLIRRPFLTATGRGHVYHMLVVSWSCDGTPAQGLSNGRTLVGLYTQDGWNPLIDLPTLVRLIEEWSSLSFGGAGKANGVAYSYCRHDRRPTFGFRLVTHTSSTGFPGFKHIGMCLSDLYRKGTISMFFCREIVKLPQAHNRHQSKSPCSMMSPEL